MAPSSSQCYVPFKCVCTALPTLTFGLIFFLALADGTSANMMCTETWNLPVFLLLLGTYVKEPRLDDERPMA